MRLSLYTYYDPSWKITHSAQQRWATPSGSMSPTLFEQWCRFFYVPLEPDNWKCCEMGPTFFRPYLRRLESLTRDVIIKAGLSQLFKTLSIGQTGLWTRDLPISRPVLSQLMVFTSCQISQNVLSHTLCWFVFIFAAGVGAGCFWFWWELLKRQSQSLDLPRVAPLF